MEGRNAENIRALMEAVNAGEAEHALRFFHPEMVQHDPYAAADVEGFRAHMTELAARRPQVEIVRLLEDGPFVVAQLRSEPAGQDRFAVYRCEGGLVAEQWAFFTQTAPPNKSGHTQVDGPTEPQQLENTEANKLFARKYYETFHLAGDRSRNEEFFTNDVMLRHEPGVQDGLGNLLNDVQHQMEQRTIDDIRLLIGQGDLVFIAATGTHAGKSCVYIDLYRVEDRKIVEHWGFPQTVPPEPERLHPAAML